MTADDGQGSPPPESLHCRPHSHCRLRTPNSKSCHEVAERDELVWIATNCDDADKDRSADLLFAVTLHDPALENMRSRCRSVSVARRLEFVADPKLPLPERALAVWHSSGVELRGERRIGPGDLDALMRTYSELGVPEQLLEAVAVAIRRASEPFAFVVALALAGSCWKRDRTG
jgi:hypothetical protein